VIWDVYPDKRAEDQLALGSPDGIHALAQVLRDLAAGPRIRHALPYPRPFPPTLWRAPIQYGGTVYGAVEYAEEPHQRIRITWAAWLPGR
jgi:hypothetical protein